MEHVEIKTTIGSYAYDELPDGIRELVDAAKSATDNSYSPYSNFRVGAALRLADGSIIKGANQENAAFPVTICAERAALFNAQSNYPQQPVTHIAVAARNETGFTDDPISPCGSCRQAILEIEQRYNSSVTICLYGTKRTFIINSVKDILPLSFTLKR